MRVGSVRAGGDEKGRKKDGGMEGRKMVRLGSTELHSSVKNACLM